jgi:serine/threonine protein kinase
MSTNLNAPFTHLGVEDQKLVLEVASDFEKAWISANTSANAACPSIEQQLSQVQHRSNSQSIVNVTLVQLILLDIEYLTDRGEEPKVEDYIARFPDREYLVRHSFRVWASVESNFDKVQPLAEGGLGVVSLARDRILNRIVAYKELNPIHAHDPAKQSRFRREAEITGRLQHPGIVAVYALEESPDGHLSYVMPLIDGEQLASAIARFHTQKEKATATWQRTELRKLLNSFVDACNTIAYAHTQGCVHRDIKPQNIMLGKFGETIVVDWGLAKYMKEPEPTSELHLDNPSDHEQLAMVEATRTGDVFGTPMFMSPEQAAGRIDLVGPRSDIYSLGATLYYLLTGQYPFVGKTVDTVLPAITTGQYRKPREANPATPRALESICQKCLSLDPANRYESALLLAADIDNWMANESVSAYTEPLVSKLSRLVRRHPTWAGIVTVAASLVLIGLSIIAVMTAINNQRLAKATAVAQRESTRADQMLQFFVDELSTATPENAMGDRIQDIAELMEHMIQSAEQFRESNNISYAKLLWNISKICMARSEFQTAQQGFEALLKYWDVQSGIESQSRQELAELIIPTKLELAQCYLSNNEFNSRIEPLLADVTEEKLDAKNKIFFAEIMGWWCYRQGKFEDAQQIINPHPRGVSFSLDRLQASIWAASDNAQQARELLTDLIHRIPDRQQRDAILLYNALADIHRQGNQLDQAEQCSLKSIELADRYYSGHDQVRLTPRGQLMDVYFGSGQFDKALGIALQLEEIANNASGNAAIKQFLPLINLRICTFRLATPELSRTEAEEILSKLEALKFAQAINAFELLSVRYLVCRYLGRDESAKKCLSETKDFIAKKTGSPGPNPTEPDRNPGLLAAIRRIGKVASANDLADDLEEFLSEVAPGISQ